MRLIWCSASSFAIPKRSNAIAAAAARVQASLTSPKPYLPRFIGAATAPAAAARCHWIFAKQTACSWQKEAGEAVVEVSGEGRKTFWQKALEWLVAVEGRTDDFIKAHAFMRGLVYLVFGAGALAILSNGITIINHRQDLAIETRNDAVAAVSDISDLTDERRERGALVVSSIKRLSPAAEVDERKTAYEDADVMWNAKVPADLLRIRGTLNPKYGTEFQNYVDGLTDASKFESDTLPKTADYVPFISKNPTAGLLTVTDACITDGYDQYRADGYKDNKAALAIINGCKYYQMYA